MSSETTPALIRAIEIAIAAHRHQTDKAGNPYILHVLDVMLLGKTDEERIVGVLHDVVEDTDWTFDTLRLEFDGRIVDAIDAMTRRDGEDYLDFVRRARSNPIARHVKKSDIANNMSPARLASLDSETRDRLTAKYRAALGVLEGGDAA